MKSHFDCPARWWFNITSQSELNRSSSIELSNSKKCEPSRPVTHWEMKAWRRYWAKHPNPAAILGRNGL